MTRVDLKTKTWLIDHFGKDVRFDEPMARHTSFRVGGPADVYVSPDRQDKLQILIEHLVLKKIPYIVVGEGTNLLVKDQGIRGLVIVLKKCLKQIRTSGMTANDVFVTAMAGVKMQALCQFAIKQGLEGMNFAIGIPGTVGGGIMMNAGTSIGTVAHVLKSVKVLIPPSSITVIARENLDFGYRRLAWSDADTREIKYQPILLEGTFRFRPSNSEILRKEAEALLSDRKKKQPLRQPSAGCFFKNPESGKTAGELIDLAGLKNTRIGDAVISPEHANYIVNIGHASATDVLALMELAQAEVLRKFNVDLKPEVKIVGD